MDDTALPSRSPLTNDQEVLDRIDAVVDSPSRRRCSLWLLFLDAEDRQLPVVTPIDDLPAVPDEPLVRNLFVVAAKILIEFAPQGSIVLALTGVDAPRRPPVERAWADALRRGAEAADVRVRLRCVVTATGARTMSSARAA